MRSRSNIRQTQFDAKRDTRLFAMRLRRGLPCACPRGEKRRIHHGNRCPHTDHQRLRRRRLHRRYPCRLEKEADERSSRHRQQRLALDGTKYTPDFADGDQSTNLAQTDSYGDGSTWTGAVIKSLLTVGAGNPSVALKGGNVAIAYDASSDMFGKTDGILGLAYAPLDDAFQMPQDTSKNKYTSDQVRTGTQSDLVPYLTQLAGEGVVSDRISFYTRRSFVHLALATRTTR